MNNIIAGLIGWSIGAFMAFAWRNYGDYRIKKLQDALEVEDE